MNKLVFKDILKLVTCLVAFSVSFSFFFFSFLLCNREENSLRHVAMVAKVLDDNRKFT